jgi:hypothetical protein
MALIQNDFRESMKALNYDNKAHYISYNNSYLNSYLLKIEFNTF